MGLKMAISHFKPFSAYFLVLVMIFISFLSFSSALEFDNVKNVKQISKGNDFNIGDKILPYNKLWDKYNPIEIKNSFGLGKTLFKGAITEHTEICGTDCSSVIEIEHSGGVLIDDIRFYKITEEGNELKNIRSYHIYVNDELYNIGDSLDKGTYNIRIDGEKDPFWTVDWQIKVQGQWLEEWAYWTDELEIGLISYYNLNNDVLDSHGANDGIDFGTTSILGKINGARDFERGDGDYIQIPDNSSLDFTTDMTYSVWVKPESSGFGALLAKTDDDIASHNSYMVRQHNTNQIALTAYDGSQNRDCITSSSISNGVWTHIVVRFSNGDCMISFNGINQTITATAFPSSFITNDYPLFIGVEGNITPANLFDGVIDEVGIWDRFLSDSEVLDLYNLGDGITYILPPQVTLNDPEDDYSSSSSIIDFNVTVTDGIKVQNVSLYIDGVLNETNTSNVNGTYIFNKVLSYGSHNWSILAYNNESKYTISDTYNLIIDSTSPTINILYPTGTIDYGIDGQETDLNFTVTDDNTDSCWYNYNGTNVTIDSCENTTFTLEEGNYDLTVYANDTAGNVGSETVEWEYKIFKNLQTYSQTTTEGSIEEFVLNISVDDSYRVSVVKLNWNGTNYTTSSNEYQDNEYLFTKSLEIPSVNSQENITFFYYITLDDSTIILTDNNNQTINNINIDDCSSYTYKIFNFTHRDEETQELINQPTYNSSIKVDVDIYSVSGTIPIIEFSHEYLSNNAGICLENDLENSVYEVDVEVSYDGEDYAPEKYYIQKADLNNVSVPQNITLFNLKDDDSTEFLITFKNSNFIGVDDALIQIQRKYVSEGLFKTVEIPLTDSDGQAVGHFDTDKGIYSIIVTKEGEVLATFDNIAVICQDEIIGDCDLNLNTLGDTTDSINWVNYNDVTQSWSFDYDTRTITLIFTTTDGSPVNMSLNTFKLDQFGNTSVCSDSLVSASGTLTCIVPPSYGNITIISKLYKDGDILRQEIYSLGVNAYDSLGGLSYVFFLIIMLTIPLMFITSTIGVVIGVIVGFSFSLMLMIINSNTLFGTGSMMVWLIITGGIIIWKITKR